ncbi:hypothetical protein [Nostoc sp. NIES-3756]|uniref:hypothetical protein n=1 Tax=Nostoc sp. NIES-3756 TaxID=1751286 RepID=UPI0011DF1A2E|nr:hypothetical protein [Nostoc sp. NIES-3756]
MHLNKPDANSLVSAIAPKIKLQNYMLAEIGLDAMVCWSRCSFSDRLKKDLQEARAGKLLCRPTSQ